MTSQGDPAVRLLSRLPALPPSGVRAERTRERCRRALEARARSKARRRTARRRVESSLAGAFSLLYVAALIADLMRWR